MTSNAHGGGRILGSLGSAEGKGIVRMEVRLDTDIDDVWSALTDPSRLARTRAPWPTPSRASWRVQAPRRAGARI